MLYVKLNIQRFADGKIVIGTEIDTKKFEKQLEQLQKESTKLQDKKMSLELDEKKALNNLQKVDNKIEELEAKIEGRRHELWDKQELIENDEVIERLINRQQEVVAKGEEYSQQLDMIKSKQNDINSAIQVNSDEIENVKSKLGAIPINVEQIGSKLKDITKKVVKWGLAVFGIRSAYMAIRQAMSILASYNPQMAKDIEYIKVALASTLQPVIERIINLVKTLLQYVSYIAKAWFGVDIFKNASKYLKNANGEAKKLSKTLAGFDEMNVLSDSSSSGSGSAVSPSFDLETPEDADVPTWLKWIAENKELIIGALAGIALGLLAIKLADPTTWIMLAITALALLVAWIVKNWDKIKEVLSKVGEWIYNNVIKPIADFFVGLWEGLKNGAKTAWEGIKTAFSGVINFFSNLWNKVKSGLKAFGTKVGEVIGSAFKSAFNGIMKVIESFLNTPIKAINKLVDVINKVPGINLGKLTEFKLPRLARGGIVSNPGKGVMMGSYIAGEGQNPEAVLPLDDITMNRLGEAIAKHMTINANITNTMNGRVISKELQRIQNDSNFAYNR